MLKLVPFNAAWVAHDKIDIHAIYRRPRFVEDEYGELQREFDKETHLPTWDLTGPLPVRLHNRWLAKGFEYVTLANRESLYTAAKFHTLPPGTRAEDFDQHQTGGPWNYKKYAAGQKQTTTLEAEQLKADVARFGSEAVEAIRRQVEPGFSLPPHLRGVPPAGAKSEPEPDGDSKKPRGRRAESAPAEDANPGVAAP